MAYTGSVGGGGQVWLTQAVGGGGGGPPRLSQNPASLPSSFEKTFS